MVKTPVCLFDLKTGTLCSSCEEKLKMGIISELDVEVAKALLKLEAQHRQLLQDVTFYKAYVVDDVLAILVDQRDVAKLISKGGRAIRELGEIFGKKVRVLSYRSGFREFLEELLAPASIRTINRIWLPDGTNEVKVVVSYAGKRAPINFETVKKLSTTIRNVPLRIEVERDRYTFRLSKSKTVPTKTEFKTEKR
ncbi:MAG: hypothetical protein QXI36_01605 [Candidatus Bathyarchaeia archaeon]